MKASFQIHLKTFSYAVDAMDTLSISSLRKRPSIVQKWQSMTISPPPGPSRTKPMTYPPAEQRSPPIMIHSYNYCRKFSLKSKWGVFVTSNSFLALPVISNWRKSGTAVGWWRFWRKPTSASTVSASYQTTLRRLFLVILWSIFQNKKLMMNSPGRDNLVTNVHMMRAGNRTLPVAVVQFK